MVGGRFEFCDSRSGELCPGYQQRKPAPLPDFRPPTPVRWLALLLVAALPLAAGAGFLSPSARLLLARLGSIAGILGGALWTLVWVLQAQAGDLVDYLAWPLIAASTLLAVAVVGLAPIGRSSRRKMFGLGLALLGMITFSISIILTMWFRIDEVWMLIWLGLIVHFIGLILYGLANRHAGRSAPLRLLPLAMGLIGGIVPIALSFIVGGADWIPLIMAFVVGLGWVAIGLLTLQAALASKGEEPATGDTIA
jgi:hypothetical protein